MSTVTTHDHRVPWIASAAVAAVIAGAGLVTLAAGGLGGSSDQTPAQHTPAQLDFLKAPPFHGLPGYVRFGELPRGGYVRNDTTTAHRGGTPPLVP